MAKFLLIILYFKIVNLQLIVPKEKDDLRQCVHSLIGNISIGYSTVLFYSNNSYDYGFYNSTEISFINIDARRDIYNLKNYKTGKEVVVLSIWKTEKFLKFLKNMYKVGLWNYVPNRRRRFIIILPFTERRLLRNTLFPRLWESHMVDVVCLYHDENKIKLYTSDPEHPANDCGWEAAYMMEYECNQAKKIQFPKFWRNYKNCELNYWNRNGVQRLEQLNEAYFKAYFVLETARQHLNFTLVKYIERNITERLKFLIFISHISVCSDISHECSLPFLNTGLIGNISNGYSTVLFYSDNSYDYGFYNSTEISFINIDARRNIYNLENYRIGKDIIVISVSKTEQLSKLIKKMRKVGLWSYISTRIRRFIIILPFRNEWQYLRILFPYLWTLQMVDVVCLYYDEKKIKLYTSDPEHPDHECGFTAKL
ncbi:hypothetical protein FQA39_LY08658 [Lamprigera yunnana]|nr:hypothetical protein FQA39_LY08658 [Lamprigera yunnana]